MRDKTVHKPTGEGADSGDLHFITLDVSPLKCFYTAF